MSDMDTWLFWNRAVPLSHAYVAFAPKDKAERHKHLAEHNGLPGILDRMSQQVQKGKSAGEAFRASYDPSNDLRELREELLSDCLKRLRKGQLKAYGFATPRRPSDSPQPVPPDLWNGIIGWDSSKVRSDSLTMEAVRLIPPHWETELLAQQVSAGSDMRPGRPSRGDQIVEAFEALDEAGQIDYAAPMAQTFDPIRNRVQATHPDEGTKGLSEKTIAKTISARFNERKESSNL